jgi:hypothetical protein
MSKSVIPFKGINLPAKPSDLVSGLKTVVAEKPMQNSMPLLRLVDGEWVYGADNVQVEEESVWAIHPGSFCHGYCAWDDGQLVGEVMVPVSQPRPGHNELPPVTVQWQEQMSFIAACTSGEDVGTTVLYKNSSLGGRNAITELAQKIIAQADKDSSKLVPLVLLEVGSYKHKKYGKVWTPSFTVQGFAGLGDSGESEAEQPAAEKPKRSRAEAKPAPEAEAEPVRTRRRRTA